MNTQESKLKLVLEDAELTDVQKDEIIKLINKPWLRTDKYIIMFTGDKVNIVNFKCKIISTINLTTEEGCKSFIKLIKSYYHLSEAEHAFNFLCEKSYS